MEVSSSQDLLVKSLPSAFLGSRESDTSGRSTAAHPGMTADIKQRHASPPGDAVPGPTLAAAELPSATGRTRSSSLAHPSGKRKYGLFIQILRGLAFAIFFDTCIIVIHITQWIGLPLYVINRDLFYWYMAMTKQSFGLLITYITKWWGPTTIRVSGDASMAGQIKQTPDGRVEFNFPERMVLIANHQIYTDWLYLWWVGYANTPQMHGHLYIILKESLKYIPVAGTGMMFCGFIFMSRKMAVDQDRLAYRLKKLKSTHTAPDGEKYLNPMWLLLFPEGTNLSKNSRNKSAKWAEKTGRKDPEHVLLPRSTGMFFTLNELKGTVEYVYDCTVAYEGVPRGKHGDQYFTLSSTYFQGRSPKSVNFHWRRFRIDDMPLHSATEFEEWVHARWYEKDALMETYLSTGRFPSSPLATGEGQPVFVETEVRPRHIWEILQLFSVPGTAYFVWKLIVRLWSRIMGIGA